MLSIEKCVKDPLHRWAIQTGGSGRMDQVRLLITSAIGKAIPRRAQRKVSLADSLGECEGS
jgi:hypothetical protein